MARPGALDRPGFHLPTSPHPQEPLRRGRQHRLPRRRAAGDRQASKGGGAELPQAAVKAEGIGGAC